MATVSSQPSVFSGRPTSYPRFFRERAGKAIACLTGLRARRARLVIGPIEDNRFRGIEKRDSFGPRKPGWGDEVGFGYMRIRLYVYLLVRTCLYVRHAEVCFALFVGRERRREGASRLRDHTADTRGN